VYQLPHSAAKVQQEFIVTGLVNGDIYRPVKDRTRNLTRNFQMRKASIVPLPRGMDKLVGAFETDLAPQLQVKVDPIHLSETLYFVVIMRMLL
jgi:hypothetical protein